MAIKLGNTDINKIYLGSTEIKKAYLGSTLMFDNSVVVIPTELNTSDASALSTYETNSIGTWDKYAQFVETTDVYEGSYALGVGTNSVSFQSSKKTFDVAIGDEIVFSFWAKANTTNAQDILLTGTSDNSSFWDKTNAEQPLVWTNYTRTITATSETISVTLVAQFSDGVAGDVVLIDNLSVINNGQ